MTLIEVHDIPKRKKSRNWHNLRAFFEGFFDMHVEIANVVIDYGTNEYKSFKTAYESLKNASKKYEDYHITVVARGGEIYLVRTDM